MKSLIVILAAGLGGCASLTPDAIRLELQHTSHISQHFSANNYDAGYNALMLGAHWDAYTVWHIDIKEGINLESRDPLVLQAYGGLAGPKETFQATLALDLWRKDQ